MRAGQASVALPERLKQFRQERRRDAAAGIPHLETHPQPPR